MSGSCTALLVFLIAFSCHCPCVISQDTGMCQSEYLEQPPNQLTCNPYLNAELKFECTVSLLTGVQGGPLAVEWFHSPTSPHVNTTENVAINRLDNAQENITIQEQMVASGSMVRVRSRLEVLQLDEFDVGKFWCGIRIGSIEWMVLSDPLLLQPPSDYADLLPCSTTEPQSKRERKCASWSFAPQPSTLSPSSPQPPQSSGTMGGATAVGETTSVSPDDEGRGPFMEFYVAVAVVAALGSVITTLVTLVACMCVRLRGKKSIRSEEEKAPAVVVQSPTTTITTATDYLVPLSLGDQRQVVKVQPLVQVGDNPVYLTDVRKEMTSLWLQRQQQRSAEGLEHSYETMTHDYEDILLESLNGGVVLMQSNEAYTIPRTLTLSNPGHVLALYN